MASNENEPRSRQAPTASAEDVIRAVQQDLAAIDDRVFPGLGTASLDAHLAELRVAARGFFGRQNG